MLLENYFTLKKNVGMKCGIQLPYRQSNETYLKSVIKQFGLVQIKKNVTCKVHITTLAIFPPTNLCPPEMRYIVESLGN